MATLETSLKKVRIGIGMTQSELARATGISRQAYSAIERGIATPSTVLALQLAQALETTVEALFTLSMQPERSMEAEWLQSEFSPKENSSIRVNVHQVGERLIAVPLQGNDISTGISTVFSPATGLATPIHQTNRAHIEVWESGDQRLQDLVMVGCDPAMSLLADALTRFGVHLKSFEMDSKSSLEQLAIGNAHIAGCHLLDEETGTYNNTWAELLLPFPSTVVTFAIWHQGLVVTPGNPKGIHGVEDLLQPGISIINRALGSGSRALLDRFLNQAGVPTHDLIGYDRLATGHLMVSKIVSMGLADTGVGVKAAALAGGMEFIPLDQERYDLVIPNHFLNSEPVQKLLDLLKQPKLKAQVEALGGYDTSHMGLPVSTAY